MKPEKTEYSSNACEGCIFDLMYNISYACGMCKDKSEYVFDPTFTKPYKKVKVDE